MSYRGTGDIMQLRRYETLFSKAIGGDEARELRKPETTDIVNRVGAITPNRIFINNYPMGNPLAVFNPSLLIRDTTEIILYARIITGYYKYVSAIAEIKIFYDDIERRTISMNYYSGRIVVAPSTKYDFWGTEDPRVYTIDDKLYMTYTGRTKYYFDVDRTERTLPVTALRTQQNEWVKAFVMVLPPGLREHVITDKNAFLVRIGNDYLFFHRLHMDDEEFYLVVSKVDRKEIIESEKEALETGKPKEIIVGSTTLVMNHAYFEQKLGWATPPIKISTNELLVFVHGVDNDMGVYRLLGMLLEYSRTDGVIVKAVTPTYIMEPRTMYELYGDRPYTIFPCGIAILSKKTLLLSYGAADYASGLGLLNLDDLFRLLDKGRIY